jgi:maltose alpha-D-glucosyltransferase/alpha-amylase
MCSAFLESYRSTLLVGEARTAGAGLPNIVPSAQEDFDLVLDAYRFEKTMYELGYEINNRPDWVDIPLRGITEALGKT